MTGDQLSALDATFLELEQADGSAHMHIGGVMVFEPAPGAGPPTREQLVNRISRRTAWIPRLRQRLSEPVAGGLRRPRWIDDPDFDPGLHVTRHALPAPGGEAELLEWAGRYYSHRLDRRLPLWRLALIEGLEDGRWAIASKLHHCLVDGVGSLDTLLLLEDGAEPPPMAPPRPSSPLPDVVAAGLDLLVHPRRAAGQLEALAELVVRDELLAAPASSLNRPIGEHRRLVAARTSLDEIAAIKRVHGGTVNEVVLTAVASGLRALLLARGEAPPAGLRAMVPVNVRDGAAGPGNRVSSRFVALPVDEPDLLTRHARVIDASHAAKHGRQTEGASALLGLGEHVPPVLHATVARPVWGTRLFNVTVTNVPGPTRAVRAFHGRLADLVPVVPLAAEHAVGVAVISHGGRLTICVNADRDGVPDASRFAAGIEDALTALAAGAEVPA